MSLKITNLADANVLLAINNAAAPGIKAITLTRAEWLVERAVTPGLALLDEKPAGVIIVLSETAGYDSDYYRWFTARYENFLYIDRVIVAKWARGQGVAKRFYEEVERLAREREMAIVADVHSEPPNTPSLNLHIARGFREIGKQGFPEAGKVATKFMKYEPYAKRKS